MDIQLPIWDPNLPPSIISLTEVPRIYCSTASDPACVGTSFWLNFRAAVKEQKLVPFRGLAGGVEFALHMMPCE